MFEVWQDGRDVILEALPVAAIFVDGNLNSGLEIVRRSLGQICRPDKFS